MVDCPVCARRYARRRASALKNPFRIIRDRYRGITRRSRLRGFTEICTREEFIEWSENSLDFHRLYKAWKKSNYNYSLAPSVNRIDNARQYSLDNIEWVTQSANSSDGAKWGNSKRLENVRPINRRRAA